MEADIAELRDVVAETGGCGPHALQRLFRVNPGTKVRFPWRLK
jgi:hypothetical protein